MALAIRAPVDLRLSRILHSNVIPFTDFGGAGPFLHFSHANGYPPRAYAPLLGSLARRCRVVAMETRPFWAGSKPEALNSWEPLVEDLIQFLAERGDSGVVGAGHSLGAVVTLAAALRRPELFRALVLIEPVLFRQRMLWGLDIVRRLGLVRRLHPLIPGASKRRRMFDSADEMFSRYRRAPVFSRMDDRALRAYVDSMGKPREDGKVELAFSREWEVRVYETGPLNLWAQLQQLRPPALFIRGAETDTFFPGAAAKAKRLLPRATFHDVPQAGHLVPMEKPDVVAGLIVQFLNTLE